MDNKGLFAFNHSEFALYDKRHRISCGGLYIGIPCSHGYVQRPKEMDCRILADAGWARHDQAGSSYG